MTKFVLLLLLVVSPQVFADVDEDANKIEDEYFVVLKSDVSQEDQDAYVNKLQNDYSLTVNKAYQLDSVKLIYVTGSEANVNSANNDPEVDFVEQNAKVEANWNLLPPYCHKIATPGTWGLDRIDQMSKLTSTDPLDDMATFTTGPYRGKNISHKILLICMPLYISLPLCVWGFGLITS